MEVEGQRYTLKGIRPLNRFGHTEKDGLLLRVDKKFYLDYFPWCEFGDLALNEFQEELLENKRLPDFLKRDLDVEMRKNSIHHLAFLNHEFLNLDGEVCKIKFLNCYESLIQKVKKAKCKRIRIDFNGGGECASIIKFWHSIPKEKIDFLEDPIKGDMDITPLTNEEIPIAQDREDYGNKSILKNQVKKPNRDELIYGAEEGTIFSSYMGHCLGQYHAYLHLMEKGNLKLYHGIDTPQIYENQGHIFQSRTDMKIAPDENKILEMYRQLMEGRWEKIF